MHRVGLVLNHLAASLGDRVELVSRQASTGTEAADSELIECIADWAMEKSDRKALADQVIGFIKTKPADGHLELVDLRGDCLPPGLGEIKGLQRLSIKDMEELQTLSPGLDRAPGLRELTLSNLPRLNFSGPACDAPALEHLSIYDAEVPEHVWTSLLNENIVELTLDRCGLKALPDEVNAAKLPNLRSLSLVGNPIARAPTLNDHFPKHANLTGHKLWPGKELGRILNSPNVQLDDELSNVDRQVIRDARADLRRAWEAQPQDMNRAELEALQNLVADDLRVQFLPAASTQRLGNAQPQLVDRKAEATHALENFFHEFAGPLTTPLDNLMPEKLSIEDGMRQDFAVEDPVADKDSPALESTADDATEVTDLVQTRQLHDRYAAVLQRAVESRLAEREGAQ